MGVRRQLVDRGTLRLPARARLVVRELHVAERDHPVDPGIAAALSADRDCLSRAACRRAHRRLPPRQRPDRYPAVFDRGSHHGDDDHWLCLHAERAALWQSDIRIDQGAGDDAVHRCPAAAMKVLVLGAGGFAGRAIVEALREIDGLEPVAGLRRPATYRGPAGIELRQCDGTDLASVRTALSGLQGVVNCVLGNNSAMISTTRNLCQVALEGRFERLVHLSSIAVHGEAEGFIDDAAGFGPQLSSYGTAKVACETLVAAAATK